MGHTRDVHERVAAHNAGRGAAYTQMRRPVTLVYSEICANPKAAVSREKQIKRWSTAKKEALINVDADELVRLSHS